MVGTVTLTAFLLLQAFTDLGLIPRTPAPGPGCFTIRDLGLIPFTPAYGPGCFTIVICQRPRAHTPHPCLWRSGVSPL